MNSTSLDIRLAGADDFPFVGQDGHLSSNTLRRKLDEGDVFIAVSDSTPVGYLRVEFLWSRIPYIEIIRVIEGQRRRGIGSALLAFVEDHLRTRGYNALYSSSQADESEPQAWHRRSGFKECGIIAGVNEGSVAEIFFRKDLDRPSD